MLAAFTAAFGGGFPRLLGLLGDATQGKLGTSFRYRPILWALALGVLKEEQTGGPTDPKYAALPHNTHARTQL